MSNLKIGQKSYPGGFWAVKQFSDMRSLVDYLNRTAHEYYVLDNPSISDAEWDGLYNQLLAMEKETGTLEKFKKQVIEDLKFMDYAPVLFISALTGQRAQNVLPEVNKVWEQASRRVGTGALNDVLGDAQIALQPPMMGGRKLKIYYGTQTGTCPPTFALFVNSEELMHFSYQRYLENCLRKAFGFEGTPIRFLLREKKKEDTRS